MHGLVLNKETGRIFPEGSMFGEQDIIFRRHRKDTYIAEISCYLFKYDKEDFNSIMDQFQEIYAEVYKIAYEREKMRETSETIKRLVGSDIAIEFIEGMMRKI